jgi:hypothetical protein
LVRLHWVYRKLGIGFKIGLWMMMMMMMMMRKSDLGKVPSPVLLIAQMNQDSVLTMSVLI